MALGVVFPMPGPLRQWREATSFFPGRGSWARFGASGDVPGRITRYSERANNSHVRITRIAEIWPSQRLSRDVTVQACGFRLPWLLALRKAAFTTGERINRAIKIPILVHIVPRIINRKGMLNMQSESRPGGSPNVYCPLGTLRRNSSKKFSRNTTSCCRAGSLDVSERTATASRLPSGAISKSVMPRFSPHKRG